MLKKWICGLFILSLLNVSTCFPGIHFTGKAGGIAAPADNRPASVKTFSLIGFLLDNLNDSEPGESKDSHFHYSLFALQQKRGGSLTQVIAPHPSPAALTPNLAEIPLPALPQQYNMGVVLPFHHNFLFRLTPF